MFFKSNYFRYVLLFPTYFLIIYLLVNLKLFTMPFHEMGDMAANALQIERARSFKEMLGPYSRGMFNHFGPASHYFFAIMEIPLFFVKSHYGKHTIAQIFLNYFFIVSSFTVLFHSFDRKRYIYLFGALLLVALAPLGPEFFFSIWGPSIIVLPMLLFVLSCIKISLGELRYIIHVSIACVFMVHNHIGTTVIILPMFVLTVILYYRNRDYRRPLISRKDLKYTIIAFLIVFITSLPSLIQEFTAEKGNISKILYFIFHKPTSHKLNDSLNYIFNFYAEPLKLLISIPPVIVIFILLGINVHILREDRSFLKYLYIYVIVGIILSVHGAIRIAGPLIPFLFWHEYVFVSLLYFMSAVTLLSLLKIPEYNPRSYLRFFFIAVIMIVGLLYHVKFLKYDDQADRFLEVLKPNKKHTYMLDWKLGSSDHGQWTIATGFALKMVREGYSICIPDEWLFVFPDDQSCRGKKNIIRIQLRTIKSTPELKVIDKNTYRYKRSEVKIDY